MVRPRRTLLGKSRRPVAAVFVVWLAVCGARGAGAEMGLPTLYIETADGQPVAERSWREGTAVRLCATDGTVLFSTAEASVRAYGHSGFEKPKKPLKLRLPEAAGLLGMPAGRRWRLVASFLDHSLLRNRLALAVARQTSLAWTPDCRPVCLVQNGRFAGCYLLTEEIEVGAGKVVTPARSGFLVELDAYPAKDSGFRTARRGLPVSVKYPQRPAARRLANIKKQLDAAETALYADTAQAERTERLRELLNRDTFADYYLVYELCQNAEPNGPRSCYLYQGPDGRLCAGPVWDFDLAFINVDLDAGGDLRPPRFGLPDVRRLTVDSLYCDRALWYGALLGEPAFRRRLRERWTALRPAFAALEDSLAAWQAEVSPAAQADQALWGAGDAPRFDDSDSFEASCARLRATYARRLEVLDALLPR